MTVVPMAYPIIIPVHKEEKKYKKGYYVVYGSPKSIEKNYLKDHGPFKTKEEAIEFAKKKSEEFGFASVLLTKRKKATVVLDGSVIKSFWNPKIWKKKLKEIY